MLHNSSWQTGISLLTDFFIYLFLFILSHSIEMGYQCARATILMALLRTHRKKWEWDKLKGRQKMWREGIEIFLWRFEKIK